VRPALPIVVAPEAIAKKIYSGIDSKIFAPCCSCILISYKKKLFLFVSSGMRSMLLIKVAPEPMGGFLRNKYSLISFLGLIILLTLLDICDIIDGVTLCDDLTGR
jgi:hypothetical protein